MPQGAAVLFCDSRYSVYGFKTSESSSATIEAYDKTRKKVVFSNTRTDAGINADSHSLAAEVVNDVLYYSIIHRYAPRSARPKDEIIAINLSTGVSKVLLSTDFLASNWHTDGTYLAYGHGDLDTEGPIYVNRIVAP